MSASNNILDWLKERRDASDLCCEEIPFNALNKWNVNSENIKHDSGRFFSIIGVRESHPVTGEVFGEQPIINQPEIGVLGYILQKSGGKVRILLQAKTEPGNVGGTQIAPTVQATQSNYTCVHNGIETRFIDYFIKDNKLIQNGMLQSEQGTRFLGKYNRNITRCLNDTDKVKNVNGNWKWFNLDDFFQIIDFDYCINTDARSVLVCSDWNEFNVSLKPFEKNMGYDAFGEKLYFSYRATEGVALNETKGIINLLESTREENKFAIKKIDLENLNGWMHDENKISNRDQFEVKAFNVIVKGREVPCWSQPLVHSYSTGLIILYCQVIGGILHFLIRASKEIGFSEFVQFGPSVQVVDKDDNLFPYEFNDKDISKISSCIQSDEGGRFYHCNVEYNLIEINNNVSIDLPPDYCWITLQQIYELLPNKGFFTNEFRSALSLVLKYI